MCVTPQDRCCCCHVKVGVEVLGWVGVVLNVLGVITAIVQDSTANLISGIVGILLYSGLIVAKRVGSSRWYLPFLVFNGIYLALEIVVMLLLVILVSSHSPNAMMPRITVTSGGQEYQLYTSALVAGVLVGLLVSTAWTAYAHHVVSRAYKCVKRDACIVTVKV